MYATRRPSIFTFDDVYYAAVTRLCSRNEQQMNPNFKSQNSKFKFP